jgi:hypothetical protein
MAEPQVKESPFEGPEDRPVFVSRGIFEDGTPIVTVLHDSEGDWVFLDDGDNGDPERMMVVALNQVVSIDPSVLGVADLPYGQGAERTAPGEKWQRFEMEDEEVEEDEDLDHLHKDLDEAELAAKVEQYGWYVMLVPKDDEGPGFAYSIGLHKNFDHPEIIIFGLDLKVMWAMINEIGAQVKTGKHYETEKIYFGLIEKYGCVFEPVAERYYAEYFGYANWFYKGTDFPALQCVWPDKAGLYPWHEDFNPEWLAAQPLLGTGDETE